MYGCTLLEESLGNDHTLTNESSLTDNSCRKQTKNDLKSKGFHSNLPHIRQMLHSYTVNFLSFWTRDNGTR